LKEGKKMANQEEQMNEDYLFKTRIRIRIRIDNTNFNEWVKWSIIGLYVVQIILAISYVNEVKPLEYIVLIIATIYFMVLSLGYVTTNSPQLKEKHMLRHQSLQSLLLVLLSIHQALYFFFQFIGTNLSDDQVVILLFVNFCTILLFWISAYSIFKTVYKYKIGDLKDVLTLNQIAIALLLYGIWVSIMSLKETVMILAPILSVVVLLFAASWVKWIKEPTSGIDASNQVRSQALSSVANRIKSSLIVKLGKELVAISSLVVGVFTLSQFMNEYGEYNPRLEDLIILFVTSVVSFYIFTKIMMSSNRGRDMFVYDNHFREENKWKIDMRLYRKYASKRFRGSWRLNLLLVILFIASLSIYLSYAGREYATEDELWFLITLSIAILAVVSWIIRNSKKNRYHEKMDQMIGGLSLSGGSLAFILEQSHELKAFASIELINLINQGVLERIPSRMEGE